MLLKRVKNRGQLWDVIVLTWQLVWIQLVKHLVKRFDVVIVWLYVEVCVSMVRLRAIRLNMQFHTQNESDIIAGFLGCFLVGVGIDDVVVGKRDHRLAAACTGSHPSQQRVNIVVYAFALVGVGISVYVHVAVEGLNFQ